MQSIEVGSTINTEQYRFAVDYKRGAPIAQGGFNDDRILIRPVVAVAGEQANALPVPLDDQSIAIVLDLVEPIFTGRHRCGAGRETRLKRSRA